MKLPNLPFYGAYDEEFFFKFERTQIHFCSDVFTAVVVVLAQGPYFVSIVPKIVTSTAIETRSSQSIKIGIDLSIDKSIKVGKSDLIDIDCIDQSVEIDGGGGGDDNYAMFHSISLICLCHHVMLFSFKVTKKKWQGFRNSVSQLLRAQKIKKYKNS